MTDKEIIKALEYCKEQGITSECERCKVKNGCHSELIVSALSLINRQKEEIERLEKEVDRLSQVVLYHDGQIADARIEAIEEFAERLKKSFCEWSPNDDAFYGFVFEEIDNLVKEMAGAE